MMTWHLLQQSCEVPLDSTQGLVKSHDGAPCGQIKIKFLGRWATYLSGYDDDDNKEEEKD